MKRFLSKTIAVMMVVAMSIPTFSAATVTPPTSAPSPTPIAGLVRLEAESSQLVGSAKKYSYPAASSGKIVSYLDKNGNSITFKSSVKANGIIIGYARGLTGDGQLSLYINDVNKEDIIFPNTGGWGTNKNDYKEVKVVCDIPLNANIRLQFDAGDIPVNIDYIDLNTNKITPAEKSELTTLIPGKRYVVTSAAQYRELLTLAHENFEEKLLLRFPNFDKSIYSIETISNIVYDNPNLNYGYMGATAKTTWDGISSSRDYDITITYSISKNEMMAMKKAVEAKAEQIIKDLITPGMRDYEKELKIYDYIINNTKYDSAAVGKPRDTAHTDYGVLILGKGVCEGYSRAVYRLFNMAGLKNIQISGYANGIGHQWNIVYIDGKPYHVDATWDDPTTSDGSNVLRHVHFNITDLVMRDIHTWDAKGYPVCNSTDYSYEKVAGYIKNNNAPAATPIVTPEPTPVVEPTPTPAPTPAPAVVTSDSIMSKNVALGSDRVAAVLFKKTDSDEAIATDTFIITTVATAGNATFDYKDFSIKSDATATAKNLTDAQPSAISSTKAGIVTLTIQVIKKNKVLSAVLWYKDKPVDGKVFIIKKLQ